MADKKRVLIVDDMEVNRKAIKTFLFFFHFEIDQASDGLEAKGLIEKNTYDLVVSDIEMPNMNGFELLTWIRRSSSRKTVPVIMLSTLDSPETIGRCTHLGATAYIVKPFTLDKMTEALEKAGLGKDPS